MYITEEELNKRLKKTALQVNERTRKSRDGININNKEEKRYDLEDRTFIGILGNLDTTKNVADLVGCSPQTVSNSSRGITSPTIGVDKELRDKVESGVAKITNEKIEKESKIQDQLLSNLAAALGHVANNLDKTDAVDASKIAVDMSKIMDRSNPNKGKEGNRTAIIINVPPMKEEKSYSTITV